MGVILNKGKMLVPKPMKEIRYIGHPEKNLTKMSVDIAKAFGQQSKKNKPKKMFFR